MVKANYWNASDAEIMEKTGKTIAHWTRVLDKFEATSKKSNEVVAHLQEEHGVPRYWARTLTTGYLKARE